VPFSLAKQRTQLVERSGLRLLSSDIAYVGHRDCEPSTAVEAKSRQSQGCQSQPRDTEPEKLCTEALVLGNHRTQFDAKILPAAGTTDLILLRLRISPPTSTTILYPLQISQDVRTSHSRHHRRRWQGQRLYAPSSRSLQRSHPPRHCSVREHPLVSRTQAYNEKGPSTLAWPRTSVSHTL
jgi:hypothetical protein